MKKNKKRFLITFSVLIVIILIAISILIFNKSDSELFSNDSIIENNNINELEQEDIDSAVNQDEEITDEIENKPDNLKPEENDANFKAQNNTTQSTTKVQENKKITQEQGSNNNYSSNTNQPNSTVEETKEISSCVAKKFSMSWIRADFSSFADCTAKGDLYKDIGYGYFCDNYQDDCGTTYYMLTLYERNTGLEYDFHTIPLP